eukprot:scaffold15578_cov67-Cyclotella_meneghiniana.AAC.2
MFYEWRGTIDTCIQGHGYLKLFSYSCVAVTRDLVLRAGGCVGKWIGGGMSCRRLRRTAVRCCAARLASCGIGIVGRLDAWVTVGVMLAPLELVLYALIPPLEVLDQRCPPLELCQSNALHVYS